MCFAVYFLTQRKKRVLQITQRYSWLNRQFSLHSLCALRFNFIAKGKGVLQRSQRYTWLNLEVFFAFPVCFAVYFFNAGEKESFAEIAKVFLG